MATTIQEVEPGIYRRRRARTGELSPILWITYPRPGRSPAFVSAKTTKLAEARVKRARLLVATADNQVIPSARLTLGEVCARLLQHQERKRCTSLPSTRSNVNALVAALGAERRVRAITGAVVTALQDRWQHEKSARLGRPISNASINARLDTLRQAMNLSRRDIGTLPEWTDLPEDSRLGQYLTAADRVLLAEHLPDHFERLLEFATLYGIRRGQLSTTERAWYEPGRRLIKWPPLRNKNRRNFELPLEGRGLQIVEALVADGARRPWCPYLFHGPRCSPTRKPTKVAGCVGSIQGAWRRACAKAGLPVGRRAGGPIFHDSRNTAVTDLIAGGMDLAEAMRVSNHQTLSMAQHYNLGNAEAVRAKMERSRAALAALMATREDGAGVVAPAVRDNPLHSIAPGVSGEKVTPLRPRKHG